MKSKSKAKPEPSLLRSKLSTGKDPRLDKLMDMLTYCRVHESRTETDFLNTFILPLGPTLIDGAGNLHFDRRQGYENRTLFTAHVDTVHRKEGRQQVYFDAKKQIIHTEGYCLGADDAAGILILLELMAQGVPAYYIFTRGEEIGGIGARYLAHDHDYLLKQFDRAVAFDRRSTYSVITHQCRMRCASQEFAEALTDALGEHGLMYMPDDTGVYTDTAEFVDFIPECTNLSVGYLDEHTTYEVLHYDHFCQLAEAAVLIDWDKLPVGRKELDDECVYGGWRGYDGYDADEDGFPVQPEWLIEAIDSAMEGKPDELIWLIADTLDPADPDRIADSINANYLDSLVLAQARADLDSTDPYTVILGLYEMFAMSPDFYDQAYA